MTDAMGGNRVGLALSGGGFRAVAFGLGALRALHDRNALGEVRVVSGISGGSLLATMWAYGPGSFDEFDNGVVDLLRRGLQREIARRAFAPKRLSASACSALAAAWPSRTESWRSSTRTEALVDALLAYDFGRKDLSDVTLPDLVTVISATDLATGNAVRFGSEVSSCSVLGDIEDPVSVAVAVAASAAFPVLLPQLRRTYSFRRRDGSTHKATLRMTDGGVYDNLGLTPLLPGRSLSHTSHVHDLDYIVAVDAGAGKMPVRPPTFMLGRMKRTFEIVHARSQDGSRARIHEIASYGRLKGFVYPYLGMPDERLPLPIPDLVERTRVASYPTNFAPMSEFDLRGLTTRGEQLTRALIDAYCPGLGS